MVCNGVFKSDVEHMVGEKMDGMVVGDVLIVLGVVLPGVVSFIILVTAFNTVSLEI